MKTPESNIGSSHTGTSSTVLPHGDGSQKPERAESPADSTVSYDQPDERPERPPEIGGRPGPEPTRYGDWEKGGRCIDF